MSKYLLKLEAVKLRKKGVGIKKIAKLVGVSKSTVSLWVRNIILTIDQLEELSQRAIKGRERGQIIGALKQKQARLERMKLACETGKKELSKLTDKELFIAGLSIYAGEGNKKTRAVRVCNSDPEIISFMIYWFKKYFNLTNERIRCFVGINEIHKEREQIVKEYWSRVTGIPLTFFQKTSFKKTVNKKIYENFNNHYGTLDIRILQSAPIYYKIMGLLYGLFTARVAQWK